MQTYIKIINTTEHTVELAIEGLNGTATLEGCALDDPDFQKLVNGVIAQSANLLRTSRKPVTVLEHNDLSFNIPVPISGTLAIKIMLWNAMLDGHYRWADLGRSTGMNSPTLARVADFTNATTLETLERCLKAIGLRLDFTLQKK